MRIICHRPLILYLVLLPLWDDLAGVLRQEHLLPVIILLRYRLSYLWCRRMA